MPKIVIADTSCLIVLDKIERISLLKNLFEEVIITQEVQKEYGKPLPNFIEVHELKNKKYQALLEVNLDEGEASSIALAIEIKSNFLIIDEKKGRKIAQELKLSILGTLGVLIQAKQANLIVSLEDEFEKIKKAGFRIADTLLIKVLQQYEKS